MYVKYEKLLSEIEDICIDCYSLSDVLIGYCENKDGEKISSIMMGDFLKQINDKHRHLIKLIDLKTTEIAYEILSNKSKINA